MTLTSDRSALDDLSGLKENVIIGKKIPAGTGSKKYKDLFVKVSNKQRIAEIAD